MTTNQAKADPVESQLKRGGSGRGGAAVYRATQGSAKGGGPGPSAGAPPHSNHPTPRPNAHGSAGRRKNNWQQYTNNANGGEAILQPTHRPTGGNVSVPAPRRPVHNNGKQPLSPSTPEKSQADIARQPAMTFQFGSFSPGGLGPNGGVQIPARTTSAPPNLDEQKREQAQYEASRAGKLLPPVVLDHAPLPPTQPVRPAHMPIPMQVVSSQPQNTIQQPLQQPVLQHNHNLVQPPAFTPGAKFQPSPVMGSQVGTSIVPQQMMGHHGQSFPFVQRASRALKIVNPETQEEVLPASVLPRGPPIRPMNFTGPSPSVGMNHYSTPLSTTGPPFFPQNMGDSQRSYGPPGASFIPRGTQVATPAMPPTDSHVDTTVTPSELLDSARAEAGTEAVVDSTAVTETLIEETTATTTVAVDVPQESADQIVESGATVSEGSVEVGAPPTPENSTVQEIEQSVGSVDAAAAGSQKDGDNDEKPMEVEKHAETPPVALEVEPPAEAVPKLVSESASHSTEVVVEVKQGSKKKNKKKILAKADAAGSNADLYNAYKAPDEKKDELVVPAEQQEVEVKAEKKPSVEVEPPKELDDWEDAADLPTPAPKPDDNTQLSTQKRYSRDFLLTQREHNVSLPPDFEVRPDIEVILVPPVDMGLRGVPRRPADEDRWIKQPITPSGRAQDIRVDGFRPGNTSAGMRFPPPMLPNMPPHIVPGRGVDSLSWIHPQKGLIPSPTPLPAMHKAEKRYEIGKVSDEEDAKQRQVKGILNKLTPQNFEKLFAQVQDLGIETAATLNGVISQIFDKAIMEPTFCETYARFCVQLSVALPEFTEDGEKVTFKRVLLNKCQEEFERGKREEEEAGKTEEDGIAITPEEREIKRVKARRRMLGNIRFIGELYKESMLTERIMHQCITSLLGEYQSPDEENIEALCKLMTTIGSLIDHSKAKAHIDAYFERILDLSNNPKLPSRLRFGLKDVIDLRNNDWQQRRKVEGPKKIEEVHRDAQQERLAHTSRDRFSRGMSMNRRVPPSPGAMSPMGRGGMPGRYMQDVRKEDQFFMDSRPMPMPMPQRSEEFTFVPQGGLGRGPMRGAPGPSARSALGDVPPKMQVDFRRPGTAPSMNREPYISRDEFSRGGTGFGAGERPILERPMSAAPGVKEYRGLERSSSDRLAAYSTIERPSTPPTPAPQVSQPPALTEEQLRKKSTLAIEEYYSIRDVKEAVQCVEELGRPDYHAKMVSQWILESFERKDVERDLMATLIKHLRSQSPALLTYDQMREGIASVLSVFEDTVVDVPKAADYLGSVVGKLVAEDVFPLIQVEKLVKEGGAEKDSLLLSTDALEIFGAVLDTIRKEKNEEEMLRLYKAAGVNIQDFVLNPRPGQVEAFLRKKNLLCLDPVLPVEGYLKDAFANNVSVPEVLKWLETNASSLFTNAGFLRMLMTEVLNQTVHPVPSEDYEASLKRTRKYSDLLKRVTAANAKAAGASQGQYIVAVQQFAHHHGHPSGLMTALFNSFYTDEVISENAFFKWQDDVKDPTPGREQAIREVGKWLCWLHEAPEEDN
ncbi:eukaryotic translation initiation factor 4G-like [Selaginella moellendorffii]|nr:eukaryotic translation initiation factor 4G-like [Selaginella moellendorffii]|eukprot:XP_024515440.1 eukaryotic translation initiation factor 4G-like [Selaginella moellendorffii]